MGHHSINTKCVAKQNISGRRTFSLLYFHEETQLPSTFLHLTCPNFPFQVYLVLCLFVLGV